MNQNPPLPESPAIEDRSAKAGRAASPLLAALRNWRRSEKRWAMICMDVIEGDASDAKDLADRALHNVRIEADKALLAANVKVQGAAD